MNMAGFSADASLYRSTGNYFASASELGGFAFPEPTVSATLNWNARLGAGIHVWWACDHVGARCCGPDATVKTAHCQGSVGGNVATGLCEACGGPGQVCCDGDYTGFSNKNYEGILLDPN